MSLDDKLIVRCDKNIFNEFCEWCNDADISYHDLVREMIEAVPQQRLKIKKISGFKNEKLKGLYDYE